MDSYFIMLLVNYENYMSFMLNGMKIIFFWPWRVKLLRKVIWEHLNESYLED